MNFAYVALALLLLAVLVAAISSWSSERNRVRSCGICGEPLIGAQIDCPRCSR